MARVREACGDAVWIVNGRTRAVLANYKSTRAVSLKPPRWRRRMRPKRYELKTPHGVVWVKEAGTTEHGA